LLCRIYENSSQQQLEQKNNNIVIYSLQYDSDDDDTMSRCSSATSTTITSTIFSNQSNFSHKYSEDVNVILILFIIIHIYRVFQIIYASKYHINIDGHNAKGHKWHFLWNQLFVIRA